MPASLILAAAIALQTSSSPPAADAYVGRWNLRITDASDTFVSGGFQIERKDGALAAGLVWRWGSYLPAKSVVVSDGVLHIVREEKPGKLDVFEARLEGERLGARSPTRTARSTTSREERLRCCSTSARPRGASR